MSVCLSHSDPDWNISTAVGWIVMNVVHVSFRMNCKNFDDPLTFPLAPSSGQHVDVSNTLVYEQIPAELQTLPSASAGLCVYW